MKRKISDTLLSVAGIIMCIGITSYLIFLAFSPPRQEIITFNVTGITNSTNASTLVQLHFECIKYCIDHSSYVHDCWTECAKLGGECR